MRSGFECTPLPSLPILLMSDLAGLSVSPSFKNIDAYQRMAHELFLPALNSFTCRQKFMVCSIEKRLIFSLSNCAISLSISGSKLFQALSQVAQPQLLAAR